MRSVVVTGCCDSPVQPPGGWLEYAASHAKQLGHGRSEDGVVQTSPGAGLIFHSDLGNQYCGHEFQALLTLIPFKYAVAF